MRTTSILMLAAVLASASCGAAAEPTAPRARPTMIAGEVTYRERIALLPDAALRVRLLDVLPDKPAEVVAERTLRPSGNVPIRFELPYEAQRIDPAHTYAVDARLTSGNREWITIEQHKVLTGGAPATVRIVVH
jgi:putative lipoprotein